MHNETVPFTELQDLSEYQQVKKIREWLESNGIPYLLSRTGRPRVNRYALRRAMGGGGAAPDEGPGEIEPDFGALEQ